MNKLNKRGFTLIEMLVVIAIIAVLVSIIIPVVGNSTAKAKAATDAANLRSMQATLTIAQLNGGTSSITAPECKTNPDWEFSSSYDEDSGVTVKYGTHGIAYFADIAAGGNGSGADESAQACGAELTAGGNCTATTKDDAGNCTNAANHKS